MISRRQGVWKKKCPKKEFGTWNKDRLCKKNEREKNGKDMTHAESEQGEKGPDEQAD